MMMMGEGGGERHAELLHLKAGRGISDDEPVGERGKHERRK